MQYYSIKTHKTLSLPGAGPLKSIAVQNAQNLEVAESSSALSAGKYMSDHDTVNYIRNK